MAERRLYYSPVGSSQAVADRRAKGWGGAAGHEEGVARATRSRWALGAHGRARPARDFYLVSFTRDTKSCMRPCGYSGCPLSPSRVGGG
jgi:hypothetical protein